MCSRALVGILLCCLVSTVVPSRSTAAPATPPASRFAKVNGWLGLRWKMRLDQVKAKLNKRGIKYKHDWRRGYFKHGCVRTDTLAFPWKRWKVTASIRQTWLIAIWMSRDQQTGKAVEALRKRLTQRYGPPVRSLSLSKIKKYGVVAMWSNKHTVLTLSVVRQKKRYRILRSYRLR